MGHRLARRAIVGAVAMAATVGCTAEARELAGYVRTPYPVVSAVSLPDAADDGAPFTFAGPPGGILLVYFGYTACPDVCPTTLADVRKALEELGDDAARVTLAMATVDPGRDSPEILTGYVQTFVPGAHALRTEEDGALRSAADAFGADYEVTVDDGVTEVIHTGSLYAVDDQGRLLVTWPFGTQWEDLAADLSLLLGGEA